ncbi:MAG: DUF4198 domain-containing protein [Gammaproteobacteria bacterium]|nr:DUF4198 domain-containing protein [Gammaproteobacteria bacterium]
MKKVFAMAAVAALTLGPQTSWAHFQMIVPSNDMVRQDQPRELQLDAMFTHPFEGHGMDMGMPTQFGVMHDGTKESLAKDLKPLKFNDGQGKPHNGYRMNYKVSRPGDYVFFIEPAPYWEAAEDKFIVHYTKVVVNGFGLEEGWDQEVGLKTEIIPMTRPYGLYAGNVFQGIVKVDGKPAPNTEVEVEYYANGKIKVGADPMITQVIKADSNGVFTYAMPKAGWWGFAALNEDDKTINKDGKAYPVEIGALLWVKTHDFK